MTLNKCREGFWDSLPGLVHRKKQLPIYQETALFILNNWARQMGLVGVCVHVCVAEVGGAQIFLTYCFISDSKLLTLFSNA